LRRRSIYGALTFAAFSTFWTSAAFLLSRPPYSYGEAVIGLFGLLGAAGATMASVAGRLADRGLAGLTTAAGLIAVFASFGLLALGGRELLPLIFGIVLLDLGAQGTHITNQSLIYALRPEARSRLTTAYMTTYFIGGAIGSATSAFAFQQAGWTGVCLTGGVYGAIALIYWLTGLHRKRSSSTPRTPDTARPIEGET
jgi:predicted MFS family arabinose efflux permease